MIFGQERSQLAETARHDLEDCLIGIRRHLLLQVRDAKGFSMPDLTFVRHCRAGDDSKQCRLAGAVSSHQTHSLAGIHLKTDARQQWKMAKS